MKQIRKFMRCIYCFEKIDEENKSCPHCGYTDGFSSLPAWWLTPGTIIKGRYMIGKDLRESENKLVYLGWDLLTDNLVEVTEYFPKSCVTRDITCSEYISCIPGKEKELERGKQAFFDKAKIFFKCVIRVEDYQMDFFLRNGSCYYVKKIKEETS